MLGWLAGGFYGPGWECSQVSKGQMLPGEVWLCSGEPGLDRSPFCFPAKRVSKYHPRVK